MTTKRYLTGAFAAVSLLTVSACVTDPNTGERKVSRTAAGTVLGGVAGGLLGGVIGGKTGRIVGAAAGAAGGAYVGYRMDQQIKTLKEETQSYGVDVSAVDGNSAILVNLPDGVTFATGSAAISGTFRNLLDRVAQNLIDNPNSIIDVYGYTDTVGSASSNLALSQRRAKSVADYLVSRGVNSNRIRSEGFGETNLAVQTGDNVNEPRNRRVEIKIVPFTQADVQAAQQSGY